MIKISILPFPKLLTSRYKLRQPSLKDVNEIFTLRSDKEVLKYLGKETAKSKSEAEAFINKINDGIASNKWIYWVITSKNDNSFLGTVCLWNFSDDGNMADIGFELLPEFFGKGIMQEVIPNVLDFGFNTLQLTSIIGEVDPGNIKSIKLMEKFGFTFYKKADTMSFYKLEKK